MFNFWHSAFRVDVAPDCYGVRQVLISVGRWLCSVIRVLQLLSKYQKCVEGFCYVCTVTGCFPHVFQPNCCIFQVVLIFSSKCYFPTFWTTALVIIKTDELCILIINWNKMQTTKAAPHHVIQYWVVCIKFERRAKEHFVH